MSRRGEKLLRFGDVVRIWSAGWIVAAEYRWNHTVRNGPAVSHDGAQYGAYIGRVVERLSYANIGEWASRNIDGDVPETQRRRGIEKLFLVRIRRPGLARFIGHRKDVDIARFKFSGSGAHLRDDARHQ